MIKTKSGKILIILIVSIMMLNFIGTNYVFANNVDNNNYKFNSKEQKLAEQIDFASVLGDAAAWAIDGIVGIVTWIFRAPIIIIGGVFQLIGTLVGQSAGTTENGIITIIAPEDILFNKLAITDINFFNINTFGATNKALSGNDNPIKVLKQNIANWYVTLRLVAIIVLLAILIYIGIRMAISSVASEKAAYKKMFNNWLVSLALVFLLHYIIIMVISVNNLFVDLLANIGDKTFKVEGTTFSNYIIQIMKNAFVPWNGTLGWSSAIIYIAIVFSTFLFLIMYIKRMITIAFLVLISPIITITYSIDKIGDGQAQAFSAWMKEFFHNVLIQPFHCLIYLVFVSTAMKLAAQENSIAAGALAVFCMIFMLQAENIVKGIFGITSKSTGSGLATAAVLTGAFKRLAPAAGKAKEAATKVRSSKTAQVPTMSSQKNIKAATETGNTGGRGNSSTRTTSNQTGGNRTESDEEKSERISRIMSGGAAYLDDYNSTMDNDVESEAYAADYDNLMNDNDRRPTPISQPEPPPLQPQSTQTTQTSQPQLQPTQPETQQQRPNSMPGRINYKPREKTNTEKAKDFAKNNVGTVAGVSGGILGGTLSALAGGDIAETIASGGVGKRGFQRIAEWGTDKISNRNSKVEGALKEVYTKPLEKQLAGDFAEYKKGEAFDTDKERKKAEKYLNMSQEEISNIKDQSTKQYVQSLHSTKNLYKDFYEGEDANERVLDTLDKIFDGDIEPWYMDDNSQSNDND